MRNLNRNINNLSRKWRGTKETLDEGEGEEWKSWPKTQHLKTKITASGPITSWQTDGEKVEAMTDFIFLGSKITVNRDSSHEIKTLAPWEKSYNKFRQCIKNQRYHFADKGLSSQSYGFFKGWAPKNWCFWNVTLEKTLESPLDSQGNQLESWLKEINPWILIGRTNAETEAPILWPPNVKSWLNGKDPEAGKDWRKKKRVAEDEIVR